MNSDHSSAAFFDDHGIRALWARRAFVMALCAALSTGVSCLAAGETAPEPPIAALPASCAWTVEVVHKHPRPPAPDDARQAAAYKRVRANSPRIIRVSVEKVGPNLHRETHCDNGKTDTLWIYDGWVIYQPLDFAADQAMALPMNHHNSPVQGGIGPDFPDLTWVRPEVFVKTLSYRGQRCDYYEDKDAPPLPGGDSLGSGTVKGSRAWIDAKTKLPVAVEDDAMLKTYHFAKEAPAALELHGVFETVYRRASHTDVTSETPSSSP